MARTSGGESAKTIAWLLAAALGGPAAGHALDPKECTQAGDFIANIARSRDNGYTRKFMLDRLAGDLLAIKAYPKSLRWFVQDDGDAAFLTRHVARVFDRKLTPDQHRAAFMPECMARTRAHSPDEEEPW